MPQVIDGVVAPNGGFQNGGWYNGRQYWNGTLGQAGVENNPTSKTNGVAVSAEVNRQSSVAQGKAPDAIQKFLTQPAQQAQPQNAPMAPNGGQAESGTIIPQNQNSTINVQSIYDSANNTPEIQTANKAIADKQAEIDAKNKALAAEEAKINDNPWYSQATLDGRIGKLRKAAAADIDNLTKEMANLQGSLATLKGSADTKVNLALKQYDINRQEYQDELSRFNNLVSAGALSGASSSDVAQYSALLGVSPSMIQSMVNKSKKADVSPHLITSTDDSGNVTAVIIDEKTGDIISKQSLGAIDKGKSGTSGNLTPTQQRAYTSEARSILQTVDEQYRSVGGKLTKIPDKNDYSGDKRLSVEEYQKAVTDFMTKSGLDFVTADNTLTSEMQSLGYSKWKW